MCHKLTIINKTKKEFKVIMLESIYFEGIEQKKKKMFQSKAYVEKCEYYQIDLPIHGR